MPLLLDTCIILPMIVATLYGVIGWYEDLTHSHVAVVGTYFYWLLLWMRFLWSIGKLCPELRELKRQPRSRARPRKMKNRKVRKIRVLCYNKHRHLRRHFLYEMNKLEAALIARYEADPLGEGFDYGWRPADADDTLYSPYWRLLHTSILPDMWSDVCEENTDLYHLMLKNSPFFQLSSEPQTLPLSMMVEGKTLDLTALTQTESLFRFQSIFHVQSADDGAPIIFDSGASITITPYKSDFIGKVNTNPDAIGETKVLGVNSHSLIKGVGRIRLLVHTDAGNRRYIETTAYYVPDARVRLLSTCRYMEEFRGQGSFFVIDDTGCKFRFPQSQGGGEITFDVRGSNFIPRTTAYSQQYGKSGDTSKQTFMVLDNSNLNLTSSQKELLKWHFCLGHLNMRWIQKLFVRKILTSLDKDVTSANAICNCMGCNLAKQTRRPEGTTQTKLRPEKDGGLKKNILRPGAMISTDQFVSSVPGRLPNTYGREREQDKYSGGTIFVDNASGYVGLYNQVSLGAAETIKSKHSFERDAVRQGILIRGYQGDNGVYRSEEFRQDLHQFNQTIQFCGVGAHHGNGIAERAIRTVSDSARAIMIHAMIHWPEKISLDLWPFAVKYAVHLHNRMPRGKAQLSPMELFFDIKSDYQDLKSAKVWGCPAYVLDPKLQDGKKLPRWNPRSKLGQFLGRSDEHASNIGLIRNLKTGAISAQFHVVYDNHFTTVDSDHTADNLPVPPAFHHLMEFSREQHYDRDDLVERRRRQLFDVDRSSGTPSAPPPPRPPPSPNPTPSSEGVPTVPSPAQSRGGNDVTTTPLRPNPVFDSPDSDSSDDEVAPIPSPRRRSQPSSTDDRPYGRTRSGRQYRSAVNYSEYNQGYLAFIMNLSDRMDANDAFLVETDLDSKSNSMTDIHTAFSIYLRLDEDLDISLGCHPLAFSAKANAEDTPRFHEAMRSPDREGFIEAMKKEMTQLSELGAFTAVPRQKAIDENRPIIDSTWAFKRKRYPDGLVKKLKARFCVRGDVQKQSIDYFDTYSPVVQWTTVRLLLIMSIILKLETKQVDFTLAFVQAKAEPGTYIEMPKMFEEDGYILELHRNLYGQCDAPIKFYEHMKTGLNQRGFKTSTFDPCLFKSSKVMILSYVDDCILFSKEEKDIDEVIESLKSDTLPDGTKVEKYLLDVEGDYAGFLGIDINKSTSIEGALELLQTGLIDRILAALDLDDDLVNIRTEPANVKPLGKDELGPGRKEHWSYPSVVGMMLYLASNSRPDIAFAVNQCARFNHCPKLVHEQAVKRIGRYLKHTRDYGLIMLPNNDMSLELYADADFAGLWNIENPDDPISVRSRTGYCITLSGLPVSWSSKLQTEIATSTMMAEYIALSTGMRELLPTINLFGEICDSLGIDRPKESRVVRAFEDNEGALALASKEMPRVTPSSKHFAVKYHWFRSKLDTPDYNIKILPIDTSVQKADLFTKGLGKNEFKNKRRLLMGW